MKISRFLLRVNTCMSRVGIGWQQAAVRVDGRRVRVGGEGRHVRREERRLGMFLTRAMRSTLW